MTSQRRLLHDTKTPRRADQFWLAIRPENGMPVIIHDSTVGLTRSEQWLGVPEFLLAHRGPPANALLSLIATLVSGEHDTTMRLPWPDPNADG